VLNVLIKREKIWVKYDDKMREMVMKLNVGRRRRVHRLTLKLGYRIEVKSPHRKRETKGDLSGFFLLIRTSSANNCPPKVRWCLIDQHYMLFFSSSYHTYFPLPTWPQWPNITIGFNKSDQLRFILIHHLFYSFFIFYIFTKYYFYLVSYLNIF